VLFQEPWQRLGPYGVLPAVTRQSCGVLRQFGIQLLCCAKPEQACLICTWNELPSHWQLCLALPDGCLPA
jgi:hypothetical protein